LLLNYKKVIFHIDVNNFFAAVEEIIHPELINKAFVICGNVGNRSVIAASNKNAKKLKIKSAMKLWEAKEILPTIITLKSNMDLYSLYSEILFDYLKNNYFYKIEKYSIDECFVDVSTMIGKYHNNAEFLALKLIEDIRNHCQLNVTIGISYNYYLAKIAGDFKNENGFFYLTSANLEKTLYDLPIKKLMLIGPKNEEKLKNKEIFLVKDILKIDHQKFLLKVLGKRYYSLYNYLTNSEFIEEDNFNEKLKSISAGRTFSFNLSDYDLIMKEFDNLLVRIINKLSWNNLACANFKITFKNLNKIEKWSSLSLEKGINTTKELKYEFIKMFDSIWEQEEIRYLCLKVSKLTFLNEINQLKLFF